MDILLAIVFGVVILVVLLGTLRGFAGPRGGGKPAIEAVEPMPEGLRILYWCETCGLEVLLLRRGTENPPRHCGESMTKREEMLRE
ncbi:MAG TPA: hypothetical protein VJ922_09270 [Actinomycetota bacterium]|nr:hypothetical protein [Actinomycetota bacterium]